MIPILLLLQLAVGNVFWERFVLGQLRATYEHRTAEFEGCLYGVEKNDSLVIIFFMATACWAGGRQLTAPSSSCVVSTDKTPRSKSSLSNTLFKSIGFLF